jgi:hypothetical protein
MFSQLSPWVRTIVMCSSSKRAQTASHALEIDAPPLSEIIRGGAP